jgi:hypothetical protein
MSLGFSSPPGGLVERKRGKGKQFESHLLLAGERKLIAARDALDNNVLGLDTLLLQLVDTAVDKGVDDDIVPSGVDDGDSL